MFKHTLSQISFFDKFAVQTDVFVGGFAPAVVAAHGALHENSPAVAVVISVDCAMQRMEHVAAVVGTERKAFRPPVSRTTGIVP